jgi:hypothetical protein
MQECKMQNAECCLPAEGRDAEGGKVDGLLHFQVTFRTLATFI